MRPPFLDGAREFARSSLTHRAACVSPCGAGETEKDMAASSRNIDVVGRENFNGGVLTRAARLLKVGGEWGHHTPGESFFSRTALTTEWRSVIGKSNSGLKRVGHCIDGARGGPTLKVGGRGNLCPMVTQGGKEGIKNCKRVLGI